MDRLLQESVRRGDILALRRRIEQDGQIVRQAVPGSLNSILHLSARYGHLEVSKEIVNSCPDVVSLENAELETPLYEACREGHLEIAKLMLETDPWIAYKVNSRDESVFFAACERGKIHVVKHLLNYPQLLMLEMDMETTSSLHVASSSGYTEIVKEILKARPDFARKKNSYGCTPLHLACSKGHLEITRELLKLDSDLCLIQDNEGRVPLHWAVIRGRLNIVDEILSSSLESVEMTTHSGETILHLGVKNNQYEVVKYLTETLNVIKLLNLQDCDGNTILHLATAGKLNAMVTYLLKIGVEVNVMNRNGYTALDVIEADASNSGALAIVPALQDAGAKRCDQLSPSLIDIQQVSRSTIKNLGEGIPNKSMSWPKRTPEYRSPQSQHHKPSRRRAKKLELQNEGLRNARETITIVSVLIATVTFAAGMNPPGGFRQDSGKAIRGNHAAFKVFIASNIVALFLSIGVVNVLLSIIPFTRKHLMKLLTVTHKIVWVSSLFMISAYIAAIWTIMPDGKQARWISVELIVFGGYTVVLFLGLGLLLARHWHNKYRWKKVKQKKIKGESPHSSISHIEELKMTKNSKDASSNSDVDSSDHGYHLY